MTPAELKRLYHIIKVQLEYGLDELLPDHQLTKAPLLMRKSLFWIKNQHQKNRLANAYVLRCKSLALCGLSSAR